LKSNWIQEAAREGAGGIDMAELIWRNRYGGIGMAESVWQRGRH
jgi:hypothetical protein